jgi:hypothetical protein
MLVSVFLIGNYICSMMILYFFTKKMYNFDDAGLRDVRALSDLTMLGCIHGGTDVPQQHEIHIFDSASILRRIPDADKAVLRSQLYLFSKRNTTVEFAETLQPLLYEDDVEGPILVNIMDGIMPFVPGSSQDKKAAWYALAVLYAAINKAKATSCCETINFETGDILILKKKAVLYSKECLDDPMPLLMGGTDRELALSYWLTASTVARMNACGILYRG